MDHLNESHREHKVEAELLEQMKARICDECTTFYDLYTAHKCKSSNLDCGEEEGTPPPPPPKSRSSKMRRGTGRTEEVEEVEVEVS